MKHEHPSLHAEPLPAHRQPRVKLADALALALTASAALATPSRADNALADRLSSAIRNASSIGAQHREQLATAAADAARPLPPLPGQIMLRIDQDLVAAIDARIWPFHALARPISPERLAWLEESVRFIVERLQHLTYPSAEELARVKAWPSLAAAAAAEYSREALGDEAPSTRDQVSAGVREALRARTALFGNPFEPALLRPCSIASGEALRAELVRRLHGAEMLRMNRDMRRKSAMQLFEQRLALANREDTEPVTRNRLIADAQRDLADSNAERIEWEILDQVQELTIALSEMSQPCLHASALALRPSQRHLDLDRMLGDHEREQQSQQHHMGAADGSSGSPPNGSLMTGGAKQAPAQALTMDEALHIAFDGSGISVVHATALMPSSWRRAARLPPEGPPSAPGE